MIRSRDPWNNPWAYHERQNGIRTGRQGWRDINRNDEFREARGLIDAIILGMVAWLLILVPLAFFMGWLE